MFEESFKKVSIIMPALNEGQYLEGVFDAIDNLEYPKEKIETILVDNGSKDETVSIAQKRGAMVLEAPGARIGELRNLGAEIASGNILAFLDSDCIVDASWLKNAVPHFEQGDVAAVGCHTRIPKEATWVERILDFHATKEGVNEVDFLPTANLIVKKEVFERVGGFNSKLVSGEDSDFCRKIRDLGYRLISDTKILSIHMAYPKNLMQLYKKHVWHSEEVWCILIDSKFNLEYIIDIAVSLIYTLCVLVSIFLGITAIAARNGLNILCGAILFVTIPILLAFYKAFEKRKFNFLLFSTVFYMVILISRTHGILRSFFKKYLLKNRFLNEFKHHI